MTPICLIETPFHEKFGVPRQSLLVKEAWGKMIFPKNDFFLEAFRGIDQFTHLWLIFEFHQIPDEKFNSLVRPPRFQNKLKQGVYATRTPHRPNRIGMSAVAFDKIEFEDKQIIMWVNGVDLVNKTPILDIKPYLPYSDCIIEASGGDSYEAPPNHAVTWDCEINIDIKIKNLIEKVVSLDPRPGQEKDSEDEFALTVAGYNVCFKGNVQGFKITKIVVVN